MKRDSDDDEHYKGGHDNEDSERRFYVNSYSMSRRRWNSWLPLDSLLLLFKLVAEISFLGMHMSTSW